MSCGSATVKSTYCSQVILDTSTVTCARAGRIAKAMSGSVKQTRLNVFIARLPIARTYVVQFHMHPASAKTHTPPSRAAGRGTIPLREITPAPKRPRGRRLAGGAGAAHAAADAMGA